MSDYSDFQDYLITFLWKRGDQTVITSLPELIRTAETELDRELKVPDREVVVPVQATSNIFDLPDDYKELRKLSFPTGGGMKYLHPDQFYNEEAVSHNVAARCGYTVVGNQILLNGTITPTDPLDLMLWYYRKVPPFKTNIDNSWLYDGFIDVYAYCTLKHSAPFLREDERLATWERLYNTALGSAMSEGEDRRYAGSPLETQFSSNIR